MLSDTFTPEEIAAVAATLEEAAFALRSAVETMDVAGMTQIGAHFATTKNVFAGKVFTQCNKLLSAAKTEARNKAMNAPAAYMKAAEEYRKRKARELDAGSVAASPAKAAPKKKG